MVADSRPLLDTLHYFDNASDIPRLIFKDEAGQTTINDAALYEQLRRQAAEFLCRGMKLRANPKAKSVEKLDLTPALSSRRGRNMRRALKNSA